MRKALWLTLTLLLAAPLHAEILKVAVGQKGFWDTSIVAWGERAGFFKKEGLDLEILYTDGGAETQQAVISGGVEIGIGTGTLGVIGAAVRRAPVKIIEAEWHGASDLFWYARTESPIRSLKDAAGKTAGFSTNGSSSHLVLLALLEAAGVQAKPTPTGGAPATLTQVMSDQIDIGWAVPPIGLPDIDAGRIRIVARGTDVPALANQTTRVNIVNANYYAANPDVIARFNRAYKASLDWAYSDPKAVQWFAEGLNVDPAVARRARDEFYKADAMRPDVVLGLETTLKQAIDLKRVPANTTLEQVKTVVEFPRPPS